MHLKRSIERERETGLDIDGILPVFQLSIVCTHGDYTLMGVYGLIDHSQRVFTELIHCHCQEADVFSRNKSVILSLLLNIYIIGYLSWDFPISSFIKRRDV